MSASGLLSAQSTNHLFKDKPERARPIKALPTDRVSPSNQLKILRAWAHMSAGGTRAATVNEVAREVGMAASTVAMTNPFFSSTGLLERLAVGTYMPAPEVLEFSSAGDTEDAARRLAPAFQRAWFGQAVTARLSCGSMQESEVLALLEEMSAAPPECTKSVSFLLDFMKDTGLVESNNKAVTMVASARPPMEAERQNSGRLHISVSINSKDLSSWSAEQITAFFRGLAELNINRGL